MRTLLPAALAWAVLSAGCRLAPSPNAQDPGVLGPDSPAHDTLKTRDTVRVHDSVKVQDTLKAQDPGKVFDTVPEIGHPMWGGAPGAPPGWGDFRFGLVSDGKDLFDARMRAARSEGVRLDYRYAYVNSGPDTATNACSWLFGSWGVGYVAGSEALGLRPAFVIYMLQEDGGLAALEAHAADTAFLQAYFATLEYVGTRAAGHRAIFVIEPDTWGYIMQAGVDPGKRFAAVPALARRYPFLAGLPATWSGLAQAILRSLKRFAPDAYAGILVSHWTVNAEACPGPDTPDNGYAMPFMDTVDIDCSADKNAAFVRSLLGPGSDRGDFIGVEKSGHSAGWWYHFLSGEEAYRRMYYWDDARNAHYLRWCARLARRTGLPLLGWQISIGSPGLPNACGPGPLADSVRFGLETGNCAFEDTFMPYFFSHPRDFLAAGFIGILAGKGQGDDTDYQPASMGPGGDGGWFFGKLKEFDRGRPWLP
jgi:hypothetical protein